MRRDGTLPPGVHRATIDEVLAAYPPATQQRQILNDSLQRAVLELRALDASLTIYVDGSYVTDKLDPGDVDLLVVTARFSARTLVQHLDQVCPVEAVSLDVHVEPTMPNILFDLFTTTRAGQDKGIHRAHLEKGTTLMRDTQPPISDDTEYQGYQQARDKLTALVEQREARLVDALAHGDREQIEDRRYDLLDVLRKRQGIIDAIRAYERSRQQSA